MISGPAASGATEGLSKDLIEILSGSSAERASMTSRSLVALVKDAMGELDRSPNWLQYEGSQYDNMRAGMP